MDTDENQNNASSANQGDDTVSDSVLDSMAAALESAGISLSPDAPQPTPEKRYSDEVILQVMETMGVSDREGYIEFARSMDGDDNGYLNKQELVDAAEAWLHMNESEPTSEELSIEEEVNALLQQGEESSRRDDAKSALAAFNKAISLDPSCDMAWFNRGVLLEAQQDARGARQAFQICLDLNEEHAPATANLAILLERIGDESGAYDMAKRALAFFPGHPTLSELMERCKGSTESVEMESMPVVEPTQSFSEAQVQKVMEETGATSREAVLAEAIHHDDGNENLEFSELMSAAEVVAATEVAEVTIQGQPSLLHDEVAELPTITPEPVSSEPAPVAELPVAAPAVAPIEPTAVAALPTEAPVPTPIPQAVEEPGIDLDALVEQATDLIRNGAPAEALGLLKPHLKTIGAQHAGAWRIAGGAMARLDLEDHAIAALTHAQSLDPNQASGWFNLGSIYQRKGLNAQAIDAYSKAISAKPDYLKAALKSSLLCYEIGDIEQYLTATKTVLSIDPANEIKHQYIEVLIGLAEGEATVIEAAQGLPPTLPEGPHMANEALQLLGEGSTALHARAYSAANDHVQAVTLWKTLIQTDGENHLNWRGLAKALENAGDLETAQKCHAKANGLEHAAPDPSPSFAQPAPAPAPAPVEAQTPVAQPPHPDDAAADYYMGALGLNTEPQATEFAPPVAAPEPTPAYDPANDPLMQPLPPQQPVRQPEVQPEVDLAKAALDAAARVSVQTQGEVNSMSIANQDIAWYNQGVQLIEDGKYDKALSSFDRAMPSFAHDDDMLIRILNGKGNAYYYLEQYPKCVEAYHQAMLIRPAEVRGKTLYNMGSAYAEMERYPDAIKCFEQSIPRGLQPDEVARARDQIRRCSILQKERDRKRKRA